MHFQNHFPVAEIIKLISAGRIQVPEFMSNKFYWGENEILSLMEHYYSGLYSSNILLIAVEPVYSPLSVSIQPQTMEYDIPARRLSRNISKKAIHHPVNKPGKKSKHQSIYYIIDGYHRLQSLYLAWYGMLDQKHVYFNEGALNSPRFCFLKAAENKSKNYSRLSTAKDIFIENPVAFMDQINKNCKWFKKIFYNTRRIYVDVIDMNDDLFDEHFWATFEYHPKMQVIADRLTFIRNNYLNQSVTK